MSPILTDESEPVNILYYGDGGTAKTTHLMHMASLGKVLVVNAESGVKARALKQHGIPISNIETWPGPGETISYESLMALWLRIREELNENPDSWAGIVWDSVTEIYQILLGDVVGFAIEKADKAGKERDPDLIEIGDYGVMTVQMRNLIRKYRDLPCHFGMSALSKREQDNDGTVIYQPAVTAKLQNDLIGWVDVVCVTSVGQVEGVEEYRGLLRPIGKFRGKDRFKMTPRRLIDPTFTRLLAYIDGDLTEETDDLLQAAKDRADAVKAKKAAEAA